MSIRLDKFLCESTDLTRSLAGVAIRQGRVKVNGKTQRSSSLKIDEKNDQVLLNDMPMAGEIGPRYFMMHKPEGYICANTDEEHRVVFSLMQDEINLHKLHTVGRLDLDTTGLLLITDDGKFSHMVASPKYHQAKTYRAWLAAPLIENAEQQVITGILLKNESEKTKPGKLERISDTEVLITIGEGRYHQVKRMFAALGNRVEKLHRESIGKVTLDPLLHSGEYRALTKQELTDLTG